MTAVTAPSPSRARIDGRQLNRMATPAFVVLGVIAFVYVMAKARGNTFFYDEWTWLITRRSGWSGIISSYNQHLVAAPSALYQALFHTVGLRHYWVYRMLQTLAHVGCMSAVFVFARRRIGATAALVLVAPLLFLGYAWEYVLWAINIGFVSSIGLSICALLALEAEDRKHEVLACVLLVVALACSEFTVPFLVGIAVELCWRDRSARRAYVWAVPLALYAAWWLGYHQSTNAADNLTAAPAYAADLAASALGGLFGLSIDWGRPLLLAGVLLVGWRLTRPDATPRLLAVTLAAGSFWFLVALGRAQLGEPTASRYIYTGATLIVLIAAEVGRGLSLERGLRRRRLLAAAALVVLFAVAGNVRQMTVGEDQIRVSSDTVRAELTALQFARPVVSPTLMIDPKWMPGTLAGRYFGAVDSLGSSPAESGSELARAPESARTAADGLLIRAGELRPVPLSGVGPGSAAPPVPAPAPAVAASAGGTVQTRGGCVGFRSAGPGASLDLPVPTAGLTLRASAGPAVAVYARRFASGFEGTMVTGIPGGDTISIRPLPDRDAARWYVRLSPDQPVTVCAGGVIG
jgi:hypothetical protein